MLERWTFAVGCALCTLLAAGCGSSTPTPPVVEAAPRGPVAVAAEPVAEETTSPAITIIAEDESRAPDRAVTTFLDALKAGDQLRTRAMLTPKARDETTRNGLVVEPPGSSTASYEVTNIEFSPSSGDRAEVTCIWSDQTPEGPRRDAITWMLQRHREGWRIYGMAMQLVPGQRAQFLNFENPADMERQIQAAEEQVAAMSDPSVRQAQQPAAAAPH